MIVAKICCFLLEHKNPIRVFCLLYLFIFGAIAYSKAETSLTKYPPITGKVVDSAGKGLGNVSILVVGTKTGSFTNDAGLFVVDAKKGDVLEITLVGYKSISVTVKDGSTIPDVVLRAESTSLTDVVVVAFGQKQRKEAVVGSVTTVSMKDLKVPSSNLTTAFAGKIAGVIAYQTSGEPGEDNANFFVRGVTTFGNGSGTPLILIDNIELTPTDLARLQPDDIESFSVLKDASSTALYGARGANGVIFVTTKQGKEGKALFNFRVENSISQPTKKIKIVDPITHMQLYTEAQLTRDPLAEILYGKNKIDHTIAGGNKFVYPQVNWSKLLFKERTTNQRANMSVSGGGKVAKYYVAVTYNIDHGLLNVDKKNNFNSNVKLTSYQLRSNTNINLTKSTELIVRMYGNFDEYIGPIEGGKNVYLKSLRSSPALFAPVYEPDSANLITHHLLFGNTRKDSRFYMNPYADMLRGYKEYSRSRMSAQFEVVQNLSGITQGLNLRGLFSTNRYSYFDISRAYGPFYYSVGLYDKEKDKYILAWLNEREGATPYEDIREAGVDRDLNTSLYAQATLDYNRRFKDIHNIGGTLVYTMQQRLEASGGGLQASLPQRNLGVSGRVSYSYDNRFFTEFNFGYNGSERFYKANQFGFFPTIGASWVVSNERFWNSNTLTKLKLRASYGLVGNDAIGNTADRFFYLSQVNLADASRSYSFGTNFDYNRPGVSISRFPNFDITWENSYQTNLAAEFTLKKVNVVVEAYRQLRVNILQDRVSIPSMAGFTSAPKANVGVAESKGVDINVDYTKNLSKNSWVTVRGSFTYSRGVFINYEEPPYPNAYQQHNGQAINQSWGLIAERLFIDAKDVDNSPRQNFGPYEAGDIKYRDVNGDGEVTNLDEVPIGNPWLPEITYGGGFSMGIKNFDFSCFFQGNGRTSFWIDANATAPFVDYDFPNANDKINGGRIGENAMLQAYANSYWSEDNQNIYAIWPRLSVIPVTNNTKRSTWFMRDGSFLRLKSLEIGYKLPNNLAQRFKMSNCRFYVSGTNLFQISTFKIWDPEMGGNGLGYPIQKVINVGVNINFQ